MFPFTAAAPKKWGVIEEIECFHTNFERARGPD
jgi:hypothetical protein